MFLQLILQRSFQAHLMTNELRNRIAHHEPICFLPKNTVIDTTIVRQRYNTILQLFTWMNINAADLLYGLDHIQDVCNEIDSFCN